MSATLGLEVHADRCAQGFAPVHHPTWCGCEEMGEWVIFTTALRSAAVTPAICPRRGRGECDQQGTHVHQDDVRPRIKGRIEPKHIGTLYRRAKTEGLLAFAGKEQSGDAEGRNTHHDSPVYELRSAA